MKAMREWNVVLAGGAAGFLSMLALVAWFGPGGLAFAAFIVPAGMIVGYVATRLFVPATRWGRFALGAVLALSGGPIAGFLAGLSAVIFSGAELGYAFLYGAGGFTLGLFAAPLSIPLGWLLVERFLPPPRIVPAGRARTLAS